MSDMTAEITRLRAKPASSEARARTAETGLAQARAVLGTSEAMIAHLRLEIARLRRERYGRSSERRARLIDQLELQLEELEASTTEDGIAAEHATPGTTRVAAFERRRPVRKPFPEHLPRERVVIEAPASCTCCGSARLVKMGEDVTGLFSLVDQMIPPFETDRHCPSVSNSGIQMSGSIHRRSFPGSGR